MSYKLLGEEYHTLCFLEGNKDKLKLAKMETQQPKIFDPEDPTLGLTANTGIEIGAPFELCGKCKSACSLRRSSTPGPNFGKWYLSCPTCVDQNGKRMGFSKFADPGTLTRFNLKNPDLRLGPNDPVVRKLCDVLQIQGNPLEKTTPVQRDKIVKVSFLFLQ